MDNPYKIEIIDDNGGRRRFNRLQTRRMVRLVSGAARPQHLPLDVRPTHLGLFRLLARDQDREQLVRIYGLVEPTKEALKATLHRMEEASAIIANSARICNSSTLTKKWVRD